MKTQRFKTGGFTNASIRQPIARKPHICKRGGWWKVSASQKPHWITQKRYAEAHCFARLLNDQRDPSAYHD